MANPLKVSVALWATTVYLLCGSHAQNLLTYPPCSTAYGIVESCIQKVGAPMTQTSIAFSCICFDNGGNYVPTSYDNAASACNSYAESVYHTTTNAFIAYVNGFCTDPSFAPVSTSIASATASTPSGSASTASASSPSASRTASPGSSPTTESSTPTTSAVGGGSTGSPSVTGSGTTGTGKPAGPLSSSTSTAEGAKIVALAWDGSLWSLIASILGAFMIL